MYAKGDCMVNLKCDLMNRWKGMDKILPQVDDLDLSILCALKENARISNSELAKILNVSETTIRRRIKNMEEKGIIRGYTALINFYVIENSIKAFIYLKVDKRNLGDVVKALMNERRVVTLYRILGDYDLLCEGLFLSMKELQEFVDKNLKIPGIISTVTHIVSKAYIPCEWIGI